MKASEEEAVVTYKHGGGVRERGFIDVVSQPPEPRCKRCGDRGRVRKGLFSRRWQPCECVQRACFETL